MSTDRNFETRSELQHSSSESLSELRVPSAAGLSLPESSSQAVYNPNFAAQIETIMNDLTSSLSRRFEEFKLLFDMHGDIFTDHEAVTALVACNKFSSFSGDECESLRESLLDRVRSKALALSPSDTTELLLALKNTDLSLEDPIFDKLTKNVVRNLGRFTFDQMTGCAYALAFRGFEDRPLADEIRELLLYSEKDQLSNDSLCGALHFLTRSKTMNSDSGDYILELLEERAPSLEQHHLSSVLWNLSLRREAPLSLIDALGKRAGETLSEFHNLCPLSYVIQGLSLNDYSDSEGMRRLYSKAATMIDGARTLDLSRVLTSVDPADREQVEIGRRIAHRMRTNVHHLGPYDLARTMGTLGALGLYDHPLVAELEKEISKRASTYNPRTATITIGALGQAHHSEPVLTRKLLSSFLSEPDGVPISDIAYMTAGLGQLRFEDKLVATKLIDTISVRRKFYDSEELPRFILGLAIIDQIETSEFASTLTLTNEYIESLSTHQKRQLYKGLILCEVPVPPHLEEAVLKKPDRTNLVELKPSSLEEEVKPVLDRLGLKFEQQVYDHGFTSDFIVYLGERRITLECDGVYYHHLNGDEDAPQTGDTFVRNQVLKKLGREVIVLESFDFNAVREDLEGKAKEIAEEQFVRKLLGMS